MTWTVRADIGRSVASLPLPRRWTRFPPASISWYAASRCSAVSCSARQPPHAHELVEHRLHGAGGAGRVLAARLVARVRRLAHRREPAAPHLAALTIGPAVRAREHVTPRAVGVLEHPGRSSTHRCPLALRAECSGYPEQRRASRPPRRVTGRGPAAGRAEPTIGTGKNLAARLDGLREPGRCRGPGVLPHGQVVSGELLDRDSLGDFVERTLALRLAGARLGRTRVEEIAAHLVRVTLPHGRFRLARFAVVAGVVGAAVVIGVTLGGGIGRVAIGVGLVAVVTTGPQDKYRHQA